MYSPNVLRRAFALLAVGGIRNYTAASPTICSLCLKPRRLVDICQATIGTSSYLSSKKTELNRKKMRRPDRYDELLVSKESLRKSKPVIDIFGNMSVKQLADAMNRPVDDVYEAMDLIKEGLWENYPETSTPISDMALIEAVATKCGFRFKMAPRKVLVEDLTNRDVERVPMPPRAEQVSRPPVVTIMGHVDHGKTTLLDALRKSNIVEQEFGGITQHIGAFSVRLHSGETITFLDTPGHAAFSAMRARGAMATDIVVLVVAADDGVMPQTRESIKHAQDADVPIIVAINKIDKGGMDLQLLKQELMENGVVLEEFGGDTMHVPISALKGTNLKELQEAIVTLAEILELKGDQKGPVEGVVIESKLDVGRGKLSTIVVQRGILRKGCYLVAGLAWAKVRQLFNEHSQIMAEAGLSCPVEVAGWRELPEAGDEIVEVDSEKRAKEVVAYREKLKQDGSYEETRRVIEDRQRKYEKEYQERKLERKYKYGSVFSDRPAVLVETTDVEGPLLNIILKGDVAGSVEALLGVIATYSSSQCKLNLIQYGVGHITDHDIDLAATCKAVVYGFNVKCLPSAARLATDHNVNIEMHNIIYRLFDDLKARIETLLPTITKEEILGEATVVQLFSVSMGKKRNIIAGSRCVKGKLFRKQLFRLIRNDQVLIDGKLNSMRHLKSEVDTISLEVECGICFEDTSVEPQTGDKIVCYELQSVPQKLDWQLTW